MGGEYGMLSLVAYEDYAALEKEVERLKEDIDYWSYCTWEGMKATCPEKREVLRSRFANLGLNPWTFTEVQAANMKGGE